MSDKNDKLEEYSQEELDIFGRSKTREEIKEEIKAEKRARRAAQQEALRAQREQRKNQPKEKIKPEVWIFVALIAVLMVAFVVFMFISNARDAEERQFDMDETRESYFLDDNAKPELTKDGLSAAVNQVYYTYGKHLCVHMTIGNGMDTDQNLVDIEVSISNADSNAVIAAGYSDSVSPNYVVKAGDTNEYTFYISPEHVQIADDPLDHISYSITLTGREATATTTVATTTTAQ